MDRFQLAKLADWAGPTGLNGRKRLQKVVYFLQRSGCPLNSEFMLHLYGPYSRDVANVCDDMVAAGLLSVTIDQGQSGSKYCYRLPDHTKEILRESEKRNPERNVAMEPFRDRAIELLGLNTGDLELGSTVLFFQEQVKDWESAHQLACEFKKVPPDSVVAKGALDLAKRAVQLVCVAGA
jgi:uncharacterized protein YwgA